MPRDDTSYADGKDVHAMASISAVDPVHPPKHNLSATVDPTVNDDEQDGYGTGSVWINTATPKIFTCVTAPAGAADWNQIDGAGGGGAPVDAQYVVLAADGTLTQERVLTAGEGIDLTDSGSPAWTITVSGEDATTANKGIASFSATNFTVAAGAVSISAGGVKLTSIESLAANKVLGSVAGGAPEELSCTAAGQAMIAAVDAAAQLAILAAVGAIVNTDSVDELADVDTTTAAPELNDVLKWDGSNWVPGTAGDTTEFTFSIDSFSGAEISDSVQLIGLGTWMGIGAITFSATYSNAPGGMTAWVVMSGATNAWVANLTMDPVTGPEATTEIVEYPAAPGGVVTFTLNQDADASTATDTVTFNNTVRYGNSAETIGNQTDVTLEALSEVAGPSESRSQTISNIPTTAAYLVFAWPSRLTDVTQVQRNAGDGYVTACFAADRTQLAPDVQENVAGVTNSALYSENFDCITSKDTGLANDTNDFKILQSDTALNYIRQGGNTESTPGNYTEADIETGLTDPNIEATNDNTQTWPTVTLAASEHYVYAQPARLATPLFYDNSTGFELSMQAAATLAITNDAGFTENYSIFVSTNPLGPGDVTLRTEAA